MKEGEQVTSVAVVMACHNRRVNTLESLDIWHQQSAQARTRLQIYLYDDGSTDGTSEAVRTRFPNTTLLQGDGSAFWNGGMRKAFSAAIQDGYDFYVLANDDTHLKGDALERLLQTYERLRLERGVDVIVVGSVCDPASGVHTYGGVTKAQSWFRTSFSAVPAHQHDPQRCDTFNANCVLIPSEVVRSTGNLSEAFTHGMGDFDYGLRARIAGFETWVAPSYLGTCKRNPVRGSWSDGALSLPERWRKLLSPKGLPPAEWATFCWRHGGVTWPVMFVSPYLHCLLAGLPAVRKAKVGGKS